MPPLGLRKAAEQQWGGGRLELGEEKDCHQILTYTHPQTGQPNRDHYGHDLRYLQVLWQYASQVLEEQRWVRRMSSSSCSFLRGSRWATLRNWVLPRLAFGLIHQGCFFKLLWGTQHYCIFNNYLLYVLKYNRCTTMFSFPPLSL